MKLGKICIVSRLRDRNKNEKCSPKRGWTPAFCVFLLPEKFVYSFNLLHLEENHELIAEGSIFSITETMAEASLD